MKLRRFAHPRAWQALAGLIVAAIVVLSLSPPLYLQDVGVPSWNDKAGHFLAYFALSAWCVQLFESAGDVRRCMLLALVLGACMEGLQSLTATRTADWMDMLANATGVLIGGATFLTPLANWLHRHDRLRP